MRTDLYIEADGENARTEAMDKIVFTMGELTDVAYPFEITVATRKTWYKRMRFWLLFAMSLIESKQRMPSSVKQRS